MKDAYSVQLAGDEGLIIDAEETTGEDDFTFEKGSNVCAVVVDKGSERGFVQIIGARKPPEVVQTGKGGLGFEKRDVLDGQSCMLYGGLPCFTSAGVMLDLHSLSSSYVQ